MKRNIGFKKFLIRSVFFIFLITGFLSCENDRFDSDKRQIMAKNEIRSKLRKATAFDITNFSEDTIHNSSDTNFKSQIQYTLDFVYRDSNKVFQKKKGIVMFTPDGKSIINTQIAEQ